MAITDLLKKTESLFSTTLVTGISTGTGETITLNSVSGLPTSTEITLTFDRVDADGTATPSSMERITGTISGSTLTSYTRGTDGSTEQAHSADAVVEYVFNSQDWNDLIDGLLIGHTQAGAHIASLPLTTPKITTAIHDSGGNEVIKTPATASAINEITVTNAAAGSAPEISATGGDTNVDLALTAKGTGKLKLDAAYQTPQTYTPAGAATATLDLSTGNEHRITMPAGNITIAISNETDGQKFMVSILQDGTGSRTVTWFAGISWAGGSAPTLTTTADKTDTLGFVVTGTDTYQGYVVGQNV